jgi:hypothetical protein
MELSIEPAQKPIAKIPINGHDSDTALGQRDLEKVL